MLFQEPAKTQWDLNFSVLGFPVRVHPLFFIMPLILGASVFRIADQLGVNVGITLLVLAAVFLLSILVHELGHTLAFRWFGINSRILLYWMGGLAIPDSFGSWGGARQPQLNSNQKIVVSLAGPFAGFCLAGFFCALVYALGGHVELLNEGFIPIPMPMLADSKVAGNGSLFIFLFMGLWANVFWNVLNLAPVYPLDGGQVARELFSNFDPHNGVRTSLIAGTVAGGLIAVYGLTTKDHFMAFFFGYMAYINFQMAQQFGGYGGGNPWR